MRLADSLADLNLTRVAHWNPIGIAGGYCVVTRGLIPFLALAVDGSLTVTQQYVITIGLTILSFIDAYCGVAGGI